MREGQEGSAGSAVLPLVLSLIVALWLSHVVHLRK